MSTITSESALNAAVGGSTSVIAELQSRIDGMKATPGTDRNGAEWKNANDALNAERIKASKIDGLRVGNIILRALSKGAAANFPAEMTTFKLAALVFAGSKGQASVKNEDFSKERALALLDEAAKTSYLGATVIDGYIVPLRNFIAIAPRHKCETMLYAAGIVSSKTIKNDNLAKLSEDVAEYSKP